MHLRPALLLSVLLAACQAPEAPPTTPVVRASFVGDAACSTCHEEVTASFQSHGMANSFYRMTPERVIEDFGGDAILHAPTGFYYRAFRSGERFYQEEFRLTEEGERSHELVREMDYAIGSAQAARTYVDELNGRYYELPLTWYAQESVWDFSPGYAEANSRFDRKITSRCMACHTDAPPVVAGTDDAFERPPAAISCERCHGPGRDHVDTRLAVPDPPTERDPTIVNPVTLDLERRLDVCQQCHLNGAVVMYPDGHDPYSFTAGDRLEDHQILYAPAHDVGIEVISHADRMKLSACFTGTQNTAVPLECTTCHDPHQGFRDAGPEYFNATCQECHSAQELVEVEAPDHEQGTNCISCHMAKTEVENAPHSTFTDHFIRAQPRPSQAALANESGVILERLGADPEEEGPSDAELGRAYMTYGWARAEEDAVARGLILAEASMGSFVEPGNANAAVLLGKSLLQAGRAQEATVPFEAALAADTTEAERLHGIARALEAMGDAEEAVPFYRQALRHAPRSARILSDFGRLLGQLGQLEEAEQKYRAAIEEEPWEARSHNGLAAILGVANRIPEAIAAAEEAVRLNPDYIDGLSNLGTFRARAGQLEASLEVLERAVELGGPEGSLGPMLNLGLVSLEVGNFDRAIFMLGRVVQANPDNPDLRVILARAFVGKGNTASALAQVNAALRAAPDHTGAATLKAEIEEAADKG